MGGAHGEERCSYRPQQHGCGVNGGIWGEAGRSILLLEASSPVACPNKLALVTFQQAGRPPVGSLAQASRAASQALTFHKPKEEDRQLIGRLSRINRTLRTTPPPPQQHTHIHRNHASRRPKTQDPQNQRKSRRLNFVRFRFPPGIPHRLPQAQSAARRTWTRAGAKKGKGGGGAGEKRGAHKFSWKFQHRRTIS